jgi:hypothetical protein
MKEDEGEPSRQHNHNPDSGQNGRISTGRVVQQGIRGKNQRARRQDEYARGCGAGVSVTWEAAVDRCKERGTHQLRLRGGRELCEEFGW